MFDLKAKLVRDKIPEIIVKNGGVPHTISLNDDEYEKAAGNKAARGDCGIS